MREQPKGDSLLACARQVLKEEILPALPGDKKHALLMVMNALSIAERQLGFGSQPEAEELAALRLLLREPGVDLPSGHRLLGQLLRQGAGDPGQAARSRYLSFLRTAARQRLRESNPKALPREFS